MEISGILDASGPCSPEYGTLRMARFTQCCRFRDKPVVKFGLLSIVAGQAGDFVEGLIFSIIGADALLSALESFGRMATAAIFCGRIAVCDHTDRLAVIGSFPHAVFFGMARLAGLKAGMVGDFLFFIRHC